MSFEALLGGSARQNAPAVVCDIGSETASKYGLLGYSRELNIPSQIFNKKY